MTSRESSDCACGVLKVNGKAVGAMNWNPDCAEHGTDSAWWNSPEQRELREHRSRRLRELQDRAREARKAAANGN